jgi:hypothetical protein
MRDYINIINESFSSPLSVRWIIKNDEEWNGSFLTPNYKKYKILFIKKNS